MNAVSQRKEVNASHPPVTPFISNGHSNSTPQLPPELLQHIFTFLSPASLKSASLGSVTFSQIAQPLLFSTLSISPLQILFYASEPAFRPRWYSEYVRARLQIYILNEKLRRAVRHVRVSPYRIDGHFEGRRPSSSTVAPEPIIDALIAALPSFPNVDTLTWHCIDILPNWWSTIAQLPRLKHLWLNSCTVFPGDVDSSLPLAIETVVDLVLDDQPYAGKESGQLPIHEIAQPDRYPGVSGGLCSLVINPATIQSISTPRPETAARVLQYLAGVDVSCSLRALKLPAVAAQYPHLDSALLRCEELEELCFISPPPSDSYNNFTWDEDPQEDVDCAALGSLHLPYLRRLTGPASLLVSLLSSTPNLRLTDVEFLRNKVPGNVQLSPSELAHIFVLLANRKGSLHTLQSVKLSTSELSEELVQALAVFPNLYKLEIRLISGEETELRRSSHAVDGVADQIQRLRIPPRLRQFNIQLPYPSEISATTLHDEESGYTALYTLASRHPLLRSITVYMVSGDELEVTHNTPEIKMAWYRSFLGNYSAQRLEDSSDAEDSDICSESRNILSSYPSSRTLSPIISHPSTHSFERSFESEAHNQDWVTFSWPVHLSRRPSLLTRMPSHVTSDIPRAVSSPLLSMFVPNSKWSWFLGGIAVPNY